MLMLLRQEHQDHACIMQGHTAERQLHSTLSTAALHHFSQNTYQQQHAGQLASRATPHPLLCRSIPPRRQQLRLGWPAQLRSQPPVSQQLACPHALQQLAGSSARRAAHQHGSSPACEAVRQQALHALRRKVGGCCVIQQVLCTAGRHKAAAWTHYNRRRQYVLLFLLMVGRQSRFHGTCGTRYRRIHLHCRVLSSPACACCKAQKQTADLAADAPCSTAQLAATCSVCT